MIEKKCLNLQTLIYYNVKNDMKRILTIAVALLPLMLLAQARIAVVNSQHIFDLMPEKAKAEVQLKALSDKYHDEYQMMLGEFDKKYADYQSVAVEPSTPVAIRDRRLQELNQEDQKLREFEQRANDDIQARRDAMTKPIANKVQAAITAAGQQGAYDIVFDTAVTPVAFTGPNVVDLTPAVKAILGLK